MLVYDVKDYNISLNIASFFLQDEDQDILKNMTEQYPSTDSPVSYFLSSLAEKLNNGGEMTALKIAGQAQDRYQDAITLVKSKDDMLIEPNINLIQYISTLNNKKKKSNHSIKFILKGDIQYKNKKEIHKQDN